VQQGTYDVLIRQGGLFGELARRQLIASESGRTFDEKASLGSTKWFFGLVE